MDRGIQLYARDRYGEPLHGVSFEVFANGVLVASVANTEGRASVQVADRDIVVKVVATYGEETPQPVNLARDQDTFTFKFNVIGERTRMAFVKEHMALGVGLLLLATTFVLAFTFTDPSALQMQLIRSSAALGAGGVASIIPGLIKAEVKLSEKIAVSAAGALAVYVISYFIAPAG